MTYWSEVGQQMQELARGTEDVVWRSSIEHRVPPGLLAPRSRMLDGYFRLADPLRSGIYYYGIEKFPDFACRRTKRAGTNPGAGNGRSGAVFYYLN